MSIEDWIKRKYYGFKYRPGRETAGATGVILSDGKGKNDFYEKAEQIAKELEPCEKSISQLFAYLKAEYQAEPSEPSEKRAEMVKAQIILNIYPELLSTSEKKLPEKASRKEFLAWSENNDIRWQEALAYPLEKLGFVIRCCVFQRMLASGKQVKFQVIAEEKTECFMTDINSCVQLSEAENAEVKTVLDNITLYKGVSQWDITKRTPRFLAYAGILIEREKRKF